MHGNNIFFWVDEIFFLKLAKINNLPINISTDFNIFRRLFLFVLIFFKVFLIISFNLNFLYIYLIN